jgi:cytosine/adenosine deaminase-related metal-dependent hydrolase
MIIRAKYALLGPGEVRRDVRMEVDGGRIVAVHCGYNPHELTPDYDLGDAVITPGWVNAHTHLELEFCLGAVPEFQGFIDWLQKIRDLKRARGNTGTCWPEHSLKHLAATGCTTLIDHHTSELEWDRVEGFGLRYIPFREFFEFNNHSPDFTEMRSRARRGYAAHSPYTTSMEMALACRQLADEAKLPLSVHLAETPAEVEFMLEGYNDEIVTLLRRAHAYDEGWRGAARSPVKYYADHGVLNGPTLAIHLNYPQEGDIEILADLRPTVIMCPATHAYFRHPAHPIADYLAAGVPVAIGTDSLASNTELSPVREARLLTETYPQVGLRDLFSALTDASLRQLGLDGQLGRLEPGYLADFAVYQFDADPLHGAGRLGEENFEELFRAVLQKGRAALTFADGKVVHDESAQLDLPIAA